MRSRLVGGKENREHYQRFKKRIELADRQSDVKVVAVYDLSRISREAEVPLRFRRLLASKPWIAVGFADGMPLGVSAVEKAMFGTTSIFAELQREQKRRRIVRSVGTMALAVHESAVGRAPNSGHEVPDRLQGRLIGLPWVRSSNS